MTVRGDRQLSRIARVWLKHERFEPIRDKAIEIGWANPPIGWEDAWAWCQEETPQRFTIKLNKCIQKIEDVPDMIVRYLVVHELIHVLPGCGPHNDKFWDHEITIMGDDYYEATKWLRLKKEHLVRPFYYRNKAWLRARIETDQLRTKDIAEICKCSPRTIQKWIKRHDLHFVTN